MRVNVISDLHLEFADLVLPGGDVLILSGDICEAKNLRQDRYSKDLVLLPHESKRPDRYARFFNEECSKYKKVFYVMGNHEHYGYKFDKTYDQLTDNLPSNVSLLEKQMELYEGVVFIGGTLWTDCNDNDPITIYTLQQSMNDYRVITKHYKDKDLYYRLTPEATIAEHCKTKEFISDAAASVEDKPIVVITHHSPSRLSTHPKYISDHYMNGGYNSNLENFILDRPNIKFWTHGHTHDPFDYMIGDCRILCNPRGYAGYEQRARDFDPTSGFDI
jgi:3',5'-cyclic AMP phosphodiesterase CpdA